MNQLNKKLLIEIVKNHDKNLLSESDYNPTVPIASLGKYGINYGQKTKQKEAKEEKPDHVNLEMLSNFWNYDDNKSKKIIFVLHVMDDTNDSWIVCSQTYKQFCSEKEYTIENEFNCDSTTEDNKTGAFKLAMKYGKKIAGNIKNDNNDNIGEFIGIMKLTY